MLRHRPDVSNDELLMFRCLIGMAYADRVFEAPEKAFIQNILDGNALTDDQRKILQNDMSNPQPVEDLFPEIKSPVHRAQVVHFARVMAYKDGELEPQENTILDKLHANAMKHVDMDRLRAEIRDSVALEMQTHDKKMAEEEEETPGWFNKLSSMLESVGLSL